MNNLTKDFDIKVRKLMHNFFNGCISYNGWIPSKFITLYTLD